MRTRSIQLPVAVSLACLLVSGLPAAAQDSLPITGAYMTRGTHDQAGFLYRLST